MGYSNTIKGNVKKAFNLLGDIAVNVTFSHTTNSGFNFSTAEVTAPATTTKTIKGFIVAKRRERNEKPDNAVQMSLIFKAEDIPDPSIYDTITADSIVWRVIPPYNSDGYVITVNIVKEA